MTQQILNQMRREAARVVSGKSDAKRGIVSAYDPSTFSVKVIVQPEGYETGFIQLASPMVGNGWGMFCAPSIGDEVEIEFQEGDKLSPYVSLRFYGNVAQPLAVPSAEFWLVHKSGSVVKLTNDGKLTLTDSAGSFLTLNADGTATLKANLLVQGNITATGDISDLNGLDGTIAHIRSVYDSHTHPAPGGTTGVPNQQL